MECVIVFYKLTCECFFLKANSTKSKKDSNDKKNKSPNNDENDQNTTNEKATKSKKGKKVALKFADMAKNRSSGFKVPSSVWDVQTLQRSFKLLYT